MQQKISIIWNVSGVISHLFSLWLGAKTKTLDLYIISGDLWASVSSYQVIRRGTNVGTCSYMAFLRRCTSQQFGCWKSLLTQSSHSWQSTPIVTCWRIFYRVFWQRRNEPVQQYAEWRCGSWKKTDEKLTTCKASEERVVSLRSLHGVLQKHHPLVSTKEVEPCFDSRTRQMLWMNCF